MAFPVLQERLIANELRVHWALRREVVLVFDAGQRARGFIVYVAPTDAFALMWDGEAEAHIPIALVLDHHRPHFLEPLDGVAVRPPEAKVAHVQMAGQLELWASETRPLQW